MHNPQLRESLKTKTMHRAETQRRRENQNQNMGVLSCETMICFFWPLGSKYTEGNADEAVIVKDDFVAVVYDDTIRATALFDEILYFS